MHKNALFLFKNCNNHPALGLCPQTSLLPAAVNAFDVTTSTTQLPNQGYFSYYKCSTADHHFYKNNATPKAIVFTQFVVLQYIQ